MIDHLIKYKIKGGTFHWTSLSETGCPPNNRNEKTEKLHLAFKASNEYD